MSKKKTIYVTEYRRLVAALRERREAMGISQNGLAEALGWPQQRISAVEAGARRLDVIEFFKLADALNLSRTAALKLIVGAGV